MKVDLNGGGSLRINAFDENIIRVQVNLNSKEWIEFPSPLYITERKKIEFKTKKIKILVNVDPLHLEFVDLNDGKTFVKDMENDAYITSYNNIQHTVMRRDKEGYFGLGESSGEINKIGRRLRIDAKDAFGYNPKSTDPLYKHWPYILTLTEGSFQLFFL